MWRTTLRIALTCIAASLVVSAVRAQAPRPGAATAGTTLLLGQVTDAETGAAVPEAVVTLALSAAGPAGLFATDGPVLTRPAVPPTIVIADAAGRFVFRDLPAGQYTATAAGVGYLPGSYGQRRQSGPSLPLDIPDGLKQRDVAIRLWKTAAISGRVTDETGEAVVGMNVRALRPTYTNGKRRWTSGGIGTTDDRGVYRIAGLPAGDYIVMVPSTQTTVPASLVDIYAGAITAGPAATTEFNVELSASGGPQMNWNGFRIGDQVLQIANPGGGRVLPIPSPTDQGRLFVYPATLFPAASTPAQAAIAPVAAGEEKTNVDLQLRLVPTGRVSGSVTGPNGPLKNTGVRLLPLGWDEFAEPADGVAALTATDANGAFTFLGVPVGTYTLKALIVPRPVIPASAMASGGPSIGTTGGVSFNATGPPAPATPPPPVLPTEPVLFASQTVVVAESGMSNVAVVVQTGMRVTGRVQFAGSRERPTADQLQRMSVALTPIDARSIPALPLGRVSTDGQFNTVGFPPGRYLVSASAPAPGWTFASAMYDGRDVSDKPLEIKDSHLDGIVLMFTDRPTSITGTVRDGQGRIDPNADVLIFPADPANATPWRDTGLNLRRARSAQATTNGTYVATGLPPGQYFIAALDATTPADRQDPQFLERVSRTATRIALADGESKTQDLRTSQER